MLYTGSPERIHILYFSEFNFFQIFQIKDQLTLTCHNDSRFIVLLQFTHDFVHSMGMDKCIITCTHYYNRVFPQSKILHALCVYLFPPHPFPQQPWIFLLFLQFCLFQNAIQWESYSTQLFFNFFLFFSTQLFTVTSFTW